MKKKGFTLVELLVVVAIIGILSVIMVPNVREQLKRAKVAKTKALISSLETVIVAYENDKNKYPPSFDPSKLYIALTEEASSPFEPDSDEITEIEQGDPYWIKADKPQDTRRRDILQTAGVPSDSMMAQEDSNVFIDAWGNPLYFVSHDVYNKSGRSDFRNASKNNSNVNLNAPCTYEMKGGSESNLGDRYKPYKPNSFQIISFGPDETTITPKADNGGIGSMIAGDKKDNDLDGFFDHEDQVRSGNISNNDEEVVAEDDITNFM